MRLKNVKFLNSSVKTIYTSKKIIETEDSSKIHYDYLILSPGINFKMISMGMITRIDQLSHMLERYKDIFNFKKD